MPSRRDLRIMGAIGLLAVALTAAQTVAGVDTGLLYLAPALVLALPLLAGRYVGEEQLARLAAPVPRRRIAAAGPCAPRRAPRALVARGGLLLAEALAERGPPAPCAAR
jgi:hypothetical protein